MAHALGVRQIARACRLDLGGGTVVWCTTHYRLRCTEDSNGRMQTQDGKPDEGGNKKKKDKM